MRARVVIYSRQTYTDRHCIMQWKISMRKRLQSRWKWLVGGGSGFIVIVIFVRVFVLFFVVLCFWFAWMFVFVSFRYFIILMAYLT